MTQAESSWNNVQSERSGVVRDNSPKPNKYKYIWAETRCELHRGGRQSETERDFCVRYGGRMEGE